MDEANGWIEIPYSALSPEALRGVVESFVLREGTDYGETEVPLEWKVAAVLRQLERGEAQIVYHCASESIDIRVSRSGERSSRPAPAR